MMDLIMIATLLVSFGIVGAFIKFCEKQIEKKK